MISGTQHVIGMKHKLINVTVALMTFGLGVAVASLAYSTLRRDQYIEIPQQRLRSESCLEEETPKEFSAFWLEFRSALQHEDKPKLFSMTRKCGFDWQPFAGRPLVKPLEDDSGYVPSQLRAPFEVSTTSSWGPNLRFGTYENFLENYEIIFSKSIRLRLLQSDPGPSTECQYAISWRERVLNHLCFERVDAMGFKFSGLTFEP
jgi:hypothetical protein